MNNEITQIKKVLEESNDILIALSEDPSYDAIASGLALHSLCNKLNKKAEIVVNNFNPSKNIDFLQNLNLVSQKLENLKNFTISLDTTGTEIENLDYFIKNNEIKIFITPKKGEIKKNNIKLDTIKFKHDLIITLDTENLENLGSLYEENLDFFYETSIINIDHKANNGRFGQINLIDLSSVAISEIIYKLFEDEKHLIDEDIATSFLTGIISKTKSFRTENITPRVLEIAGNLVSMGAKREEIINNLFKQQTVPILKLWGRALSRLQYNDNIGLVWTALLREDFIKSGAGPEKLKDVIDELITNSPDAKIILLIYENENSVCCILRSENTSDLQKLSPIFGGITTGNELKFCMTNKNVMEAEKYILEEIKKVTS